VQKKCPRPAHDSQKMITIPAGIGIAAPITATAFMPSPRLPNAEEIVMPHAWSDKRERQYQHIKESAEDSGKTEQRAKEIAARTVNKQRREAGDTPNSTTSGTGNPNTALEGRTKDELYNIAKKYNIHGRSRMNKSQLISAIRKQQ